MLHFPKKETIETKSFSNPTLSFIDFLQDGGNFDLAAHASIKLYKEASPFFNAVDIPPKLKSLFPKILEGISSVDSDDDGFVSLTGELARLQSEYTILARSLIERGKRNSEFQSRVDKLRTDGIIIGEKK